MPSPEVKQKIIDIIARGTDPISEISTEAIADKIMDVLAETMMALAKASVAAERARCAAIALSMGYRGVAEAIERGDK